MRQRMFLPIYFLILLFDLSKGVDEKPSLYNYAGCVISGMQDADFNMGYDNTPIKDDFKGTIATFQTKDVYGVEISGTNYFNATLESDTLRIFTTDEYKNVEPEIGYDPFPEIKFQLDLQCIKGNISLRFVQPLTDVNNHDPYFEKEIYEYIYVQNSLPSNHQLTDNQSLSAFDIDMTNNRLSFSIEENDYFSIDTASTDSTTRQTFTTLTSLKDIEAPSTIKLNLSATDVGKPTRSATTVLEVNVLLRSDGEVPIPSFLNDSYTVIYKNGELIFNEEIRLANGSGYFANITQIGYEDYFRVTFLNRAEGVLKIDLLQPLSNLSQTKDDNIQFEIQLFNDGSSQPAVTTVVVDIYQDQENSNDEVTSCSARPTLSKYVYVARYFNGFLGFEDEIRITSEDHSNLTISQNDWYNHFKPILIKDKILMTVVKPLPRVILATNPFILFDIKVTKNNKESCSTGAAILVKLLPPPLPPLPINDGGFSFQRNTYVAFYKGDLELTFQQPILLVGQVNSVILRMQNSNYTNYFYVKSPFRKLVTIQLKQTLKRTDFDNGIILFDIVALSTNSLNSATASVVVVWDGPKTILIFFTDYLSGFVYIFLLLTILLAICAAIGFKLMHKTRRPVPSTALQPPPPYTPNSEEK